MPETPEHSPEALQSLQIYHAHLSEIIERWVADPNETSEITPPPEVTQVMAQIHKDGGISKIFYSPEMCARRCLEVIENAGDHIPKLTKVRKTDADTEEEFLEKKHLLQHTGINALLEQEHNILNYTSLIKAFSHQNDKESSVKRIQDLIARTLIIDTKEALVVIQKTSGDKITQTGVYMLNPDTKEINSWYILREKESEEQPLGVFSSTNSQQCHQKAWEELETIIEKYYDSDDDGPANTTGPRQPINSSRIKPKRREMGLQKL